MTGEERDDLTPEELRALAELWRDELARGWVPKPADIEAGREVLRERRRSSRSEVTRSPCDT